MQGPAAQVVALAASLSDWPNEIVLGQSPLLHQAGCAFGAIWHHQSRGLVQSVTIGQSQAEENAGLSRTGIVRDDVGGESEPLVKGD
jgi:hypothetical protein